MEIVNRISRMKEIIKDLKKEGKTIGLVLTMGCLHEGHLSLIKEARRMSDVVIASIFVNPKQFGPHEDYEKYPRNIAQDADILLKENVDYIFYPSADEMYSENFNTYVEVAELSQKLCGKSRPGHFRGVATVVIKLLNIVQPHYAFFGQKDAQQAIIIRRMIKDLNVDVEIITVPIVRDVDGLALSSRNIYLNEEERKAAIILYHALQQVHKLIKNGEKRTSKLIQEIKKTIESEPHAKIDYVEIVNLENLSAVKTVEKPSLIALAVYIGSTRLIDNIIVEAK